MEEDIRTFFIKTARIAVQSGAVDMMPTRGEKSGWVGGVIHA